MTRHRTKEHTLNVGRAWRRERRAVSFSETDSGSKVIIAQTQVAHEAVFRKIQVLPEERLPLVIKRKALEPARPSYDCDSQLKLVLILLNLRLPICKMV